MDGERDKHDKKAPGNRRAIEDREEEGGREGGTLKRLWVER